MRAIHVPAAGAESVSRRPSSLDESDVESVLFEIQVEWRAAVRRGAYDLAGTLDRARAAIEFMDEGGTL